MSFSYPNLSLKPGKEKSFKNRHPWLFSGAVQKLPKGNPAVVQVFSAAQEPLGYGFYDPSSQIVCRLFEFGPVPPDVMKNREYWKQKIVKALQVRQTLGVPSESNAYRLLHAEGDFFPGIIADVYGDSVMIHMMIDAVKELQPLLEDIFKELGYTRIYCKFSPSKNAENAEWIGDAPRDAVEIMENGVKFWADLAEGQKTGLFLDQRYARQRVGELSHGKKVLNTFGYQGGFSLHALKNGAEKVTTVDISAAAIEWCEKNVVLNFAEGCSRHEGVVADCFDYLRRMNSEFDLIILDPPAFAKSQASVDKAARGYKDINFQAIKKALPGSLLFTFSCSQKISPDLFQKIVFGAAADAGRQVRIIEKLSQPEDHPVNIYHPEGEYIKGLLLYIE